jgi:hypothetical protein
MRPIASLLVVAALLFGVYEFYLKKMPASDPGTAPTQAFSLTGVRADLIQIALAERATIAGSGSCASLEQLLSSGAMTMNRSERDGYTYQIVCRGSEFEVTAEHPPAPVGSPIHYPRLTVDATLEFRENTPN